MVIAKSEEEAQKKIQNGDYETDPISIKTIDVKIQSRDEGFCEKIEFVNKEELGIVTGGQKARTWLCQNKTDNDLEKTYYFYQNE